MTLLLAFDTATPHVTVALHDGSSVLATFASTEPMRHGEMLAPGIAHVLEEAGATPADLTAVAVGVGPGPFTGLRVGLVTARTLGFVRGVPVHGVCTLDVLAAEAVDGGLSDFAVATDARRKEVYLATYAAGRRVEGPRVVRPVEAARAGPVVGRGAMLYAEHFPGATGPEQPAAAVLAAVVLEQRVEVLAPEPLYLRRPDAVEPGKPKRVS